MAPSAELVEQLRTTIPELPWLARKRIQEEWGITDEVMRDLVNNGVIDWSPRPSNTARRASRPAHGGQLPVQKANERGVAVSELAITPAQVAVVVKLVDDGKLFTKRPGRWSRACWPARVSLSR